MENKVVQQIGQITIPGAFNIIRTVYNSFSCGFNFHFLFLRSFICKVYRYTPPLFLVALFHVQAP